MHQDFGNFTEVKGTDAFSYAATVTVVLITVHEDLVTGYYESEHSVKNISYITSS